MRSLGLPVLLVCVGFVSATSSAVRAQSASADVGQILAESRVALGGPRLDAIKTFVATGRTRQIQGDNLVPIEFEISCERPDKCIRRDEVPARASGPTTIGFSGDALIQMPASPGPAGPAPAARIASTKEEFARLILGMIAGPWASDITFSRLGEAQAPQGMADVLAVAGPSEFTARLFILRDTHLPIMLTWSGAGPTPVENRLYYADYRDVDGMKFPFRLRRAVGADTVEETTFDRFRINVRIDPKRFEVAR